MRGLGNLAAGAFADAGVSGERTACIPAAATSFEPGTRNCSMDDVGATALGVLRFLRVDSVRPSGVSPPYWKC